MSFRITEGLLLPPHIPDSSLSSDSSDEEEDHFEMREGSPEGRNSRFLFRGVHFSPEHFNREERTLARQRDDHFKTVYSGATLDIGKKMSSPYPDYEKADQCIKNYFEMLKLTPDKPQFEKDYNRTRKERGIRARFPSLYQRFVQTYVTTPKKLFGEGGMTRNFNFCADTNPLLSTSTDLVEAFHVGSGQSVAEESRYYPTVGLSTGTLKHRRLGYVEVYSIDQPFLDECSIQVSKLVREKVIDVDRPQKHAHEIAVISSMPQHRVVGYQVIALPSMKAPWSPSILTRFGLNEKDYHHYQNSLRNADNRNVLKELIQQTVEHQAKCVMANFNPCLDSPSGPGAPGLPEPETSPTPIRVPKEKSPAPTGVLPDDSDVEFPRSDVFANTLFDSELLTRQSFIHVHESSLPIASPYGAGGMFLQPLPEEEMSRKVDYAKAYLHSIGFEFYDVEGDGNCFFHAFLESYTGLAPNRRIPELDAEQDKISYLRNLIAARSDLLQPGSRSNQRIDEIMTDKRYIASDEGDVLSAVFNIPIRIISVNSDNHGVGCYDSLTRIDEHGQLHRTEWDGSLQGEYIFIVDLGVHFACAKPSFP